MATTPYWELHIRPMFRFIDRDHMLFALDLLDYQSVVDHADDIARKLSQDMPTKATGGLWPEEWVALFDRWVKSKFPRLDRPTGVTYTLQNDDDDVLLIAEGTTPGGGDTWFERDNDNQAPREYTLVHRPLKPGAKPFRAQETLPGSTTSVIVHDGDGKHEVRM